MKKAGWMEIEAERKRNDSNHGNETGTIAYSSPTIHKTTLIKMNQWEEWA
jgi:hypothetical protein